MRFCSLWSFWPFLVAIDHYSSLLDILITFYHLGNYWAIYLSFMRFCSLWSFWSFLVAIGHYSSLLATTVHCAQFGHFGLV